MQILYEYKIAIHREYGLSKRTQLESCVSEIVSLVKHRQIAR